MVVAIAWRLLIPAIVGVAEAVSPTPLPPDAAANPISAVYSWAQLFALLTDRALWLCFLGLILWLAWWLIKKKDAEIAEKTRKLEEQYAWQQEKLEELAVLVSSNTKVLERLDRKL